MSLTKLVDIKNSNKSGVIPFYVNEAGEIRMLFMVPSDPHYGGTHPQIAKGGIDPGETAESTALREGYEELGLKDSNISHFVQTSIKENLTRADGAVYTMDVFVAKVINPFDFSKPHYETGAVYWLSVEQFMQTGRRIQRSLVKRAVEVIKEIINEPK